MHVVSQRNRHSLASVAHRPSNSARTSDKCGCAACLGIGGSLPGGCASIPTRRPCDNEGRASQGYLAGWLPRSYQTSPTDECGGPVGECQFCTSGRYGHLAQGQHVAGESSSAHGNPRIHHATLRCFRLRSSATFSASLVGKPASRSCEYECQMAPCQSPHHTSRRLTESARCTGRDSHPMAHSPVAIAARIPLSSRTAPSFAACSACGSPVYHTTRKGVQRALFAHGPDRQLRSISAGSVWVMARRTCRNMDRCSYQPLYSNGRRMRGEPHAMGTV